VATNSLLEGKGGPIALITTAGFEDILFIGRQNRKHLYSLKPETRKQILPRQNCFGLEERTTAGGRVEKSVAGRELSRVLDAIERKGVPAVAVSLINSYANPANEKIVTNALKERKLMASISSDILPEYREYERTVLTAVNAFLMPVISRYLEKLEDTLAPARLWVMQSNEGYISPSTARREPIRTALSGPAGGVVAGFHIGKAAGFENIITLDMGGTSTDVSLVDGQIRRTSESTIGDYPVRLPMIDIHTVGAGGGSIAYLDKGGSLKVGPKSAGADPGPACYGKSLLPTVTDANFVLGRLVPEYFLGGRMPIHPERSRRAMTKLARTMGKNHIEAAEGIIAVANANMEKAIRVISIERGFDPKNFILLSFGGAGGMHAVEIAEHLRIPRVIIPKNAGVLSALGLLLADSIKDFSLSVLKRTERIKKENLDNRFEILGKQGREAIKKEGFEDSEIRILPYLDMRYLGQSYEITLPYRGFGRCVSDFHRAHRKLYSYHQPEHPTEIVNIRVKAVGTGKKIKLVKHPSAGARKRKPSVMHQNLNHKGKTYQASVYDRSLLFSGSILEGPALVADFESTCFIPPSFTAKVDGYMNLIVER